MNTNIFGLPTWFVIIGIIILLSFIVYLVIKAMKEGREISFWPPKIGQKPIYDETSKKASEKIAAEESGSNIAQVLLNSSPIGLLQITSGDKQGVCIVLTENIRKITIGRAGDVVIKDERISNRHCVIRITPSENESKNERDYTYELWDLGSSNGTFLNGKRIRNAEELKNGDLIQLGGTRLLLHLWD